jgi:hypothetical protein
MEGIKVIRNQAIPSIPFIPVGPPKIKNAFRVCDKRKAERQKINALALRIIVVNSQNGVHKSK